MPRPDESPGASLTLLACPRSVLKRPGLRLNAGAKRARIGKTGSPTKAPITVPSDNGGRQIALEITYVAPLRRLY